MRKGKFLAAVLIGLMVLSLPLGALLSAMPVVGSDASKVPAGYKALTAYVTYVDKGDVLRITVEDAAEYESTIYVTDDTFVFDNVRFAVGEKLMFFYDLSLPVPMIYPPRYTAAVVAKTEGANSAFVGVFDEDMLSSDKALKLNHGPNTVVVDEDGNDYDGNLIGKVLVVTYAITTASIPPQTTPSKIVVLGASSDVDATEVVTAEPADPEDPDALSAGAVANMPIVVEGKILSGTSAYLNSGGVVMIPVRAIAEALGFTVLWDDVICAVVINNTMTITPGKDYYTFARMAPIELGTAPEIVNGRTFVPLSFFSAVAGENHARIYDGQIVIDNLE